MQERQNIGIDAGGTLLKLVYFKGETLNFKTFSSNELSRVTKWLNNHYSSSNVYVTGGQGLILSQQLNMNSHMIDEFQATCKGVRYLIEEQVGCFSEPVIVTNIGTGTSIHYINMAEEERLSGTGIGGGTFIGLSSLLTGVREFTELAKLSLVGQRDEVDIKVKDIYEGSTPPISGELTASNFGKAKYKEKEGITAADQVAGVAGMIAEVITLISINEAHKHNVKTIYYIGSTVSVQSLIYQLLADYTARLGYTPKFLSKGQFSGAIGALKAGTNDL